MCVLESDKKPKVLSIEVVVTDVVPEHTLCLSGRRERVEVGGRSGFVEGVRTAHFCELSK